MSIYCGKERKVRFYRGDKKGNYKFEKGAHYQMKSTWPVKNEFGKVISLCTMVMNVSSNGITEIVEFNGENCELLSEEYKELIEQNDELLIQGLPYIVLWRHS